MWTRTGTGVAAQQAVVSGTAGAVSAVRDGALAGASAESLADTLTEVRQVQAQLEWVALRSFARSTSRVATSSTAR